MISKGEATKKKILESACDLFYLKGYRGTTVDDILKASKVKKGNFYFHFKSKEALGYAVLEIYRLRSTSQFQKVLQSEREPIDRIYSLFSSNEKKLKSSRYQGGCPFGNLALELADHHPGFRRELQSIFDRWAGEVGAVLEEAKKRGTLASSIDTKELSYFIVAVMEGGILLSKTKKTGEVHRCIIKSFKVLMNRLIGQPAL